MRLLPNSPGYDCELFRALYGAWVIFYMTIKRMIGVIYIYIYNEKKTPNSSIATNLSCHCCMTYFYTYDHYSYIFLSYIRNRVTWYFCCWRIFIALRSGSPNWLIIIALYVSTKVNMNQHILCSIPWASQYDVSSRCSKISKYSEIFHP